MGNKNQMIKSQSAPSKTKVDAVIALYSSGKIEEAINATKDLNEDYPNNPILFNILGVCYKALNQLEAAGQMFKISIAIKPDYAEAYFNLGVVLRGLSQLDEAIKNYKKAIALSKNYPDAYNNLGNSLKEIGKLDEAIENYEWAIAYKHDFYQAYNNLGLVQAEIGLSKLAVKNFENALKLKPEFLDSHFNLGITLKELGRKELSINSFVKTIEIDSNNVEAHRNLSLMKQYSDNDPQIQVMESLINKKNLSKQDYVGLNFALSKVYEDLEDNEKQFKFLNEGNKLKKDLIDYSIDKDKKRFSIFKKLFSSPSITDSKKTYNKSAISPIFIVGMPRSGTSLVEQIIASHQKVYGGGELKYFAENTLPVISRALDNDSKKFSKKDFLSIRDKYIEALAKLKTTNNIITDKMPLNFQYIGFILSAFPEAKIVHLKRDARAICWSNYKFLFATAGNGFSFNQKDLAEYYALYADLMEFWHKRYPNKIYDIIYEDLTVNQEEETRKLLKYCELDWDENCLNFHTNERTVKTVSSIQVRQKIYQDSSEAWKKYDKFLKPLIKGLGSY